MALDGKARRRKGHDFERWVACQLRERGGYAGAARRPQGRGSKDGCDVEGTPFWVECKRRARLTPRQGERFAFRAMMDAAAVGDKRPVLVVAKEDRGVVWVWFQYSGYEGTHGILMTTFDSWLAGPRL